MIMPTTINIDKPIIEKLKRMKIGISRRASTYFEKIISFEDTGICPAMQKQCVESCPLSRKTIEYKKDLIDGVYKEIGDPIVKIHCAIFSP